MVSLVVEGLLGVWEIVGSTCSRDLKMSNNMELAIQCFIMG